MPRGEDREGFVDRLRLRVGHWISEVDYTGRSGDLEHPRHDRRAFWRFKRGFRIADVNLSERGRDCAQIGAALVAKTAYLARDWRFALRAYVNHSE